MALDLKDFQTSALSLTDFEGQLPVGKTVNEKSAKVVAAADAAIQGGNIETYEQTKARLLDPAAQEQFTIEQQQLRDSMWREFVEPGIPDIITDPNIDDETKDQLISSALIPQDGRRFLSTTSTLSSKLLVLTKMSTPRKQLRKPPISSLTRLKELTTRSVVDKLLSMSLSLVKIWVRVRCS